MSILDKLGITGLRSYSTERIEVIDFHKPLTLILGKNGTGKTTIIEALRYVICGILPPGSSSGKSFINDPRINNKTESKAAVKLKFNALNGKPVLCVRTLQLSFLNKKEEFRKLEQFLKIKQSENETITIGHNCAEIDKQVPDLLGASKAVIENVSLCHQEESLWPFSDNMTLKKVFDELFDTARVAKLAEIIKSTIKNKKKQMKEEKMEAEILKNNYEHFIQILDDFQKQTEKIIELQNQISQEEQQIIGEEEINSITAIQRNLGSYQLQQQQAQQEQTKIIEGLNSFQSLNMESTLEILNRHAQFSKNNLVYNLERSSSLDIEGYEKLFDQLLYKTQGDQQFIEQSLIDRGQSFQKESSSTFQNQSQLNNLNDTNHFETALSYLQGMVKQISIEMSNMNKKIELISVQQPQSSAIICVELSQISIKVLGKYYSSQEMNNEILEASLLPKCIQLKQQTDQEVQLLFKDLAQLESDFQTQMQQVNEKYSQLKAKLENYKKIENLKELKIMQSTLQSEIQKLESEKFKEKIVFQEVQDNANELQCLSKQIKKNKINITTKKYKDYESQRRQICKKLGMEAQTNNLTTQTLGEMITENENLLKSIEERKVELRTNISQQSMEKKKKEQSLEGLQKIYEEFKTKFRKLNIKFEGANPYEKYKQEKQKLEQQQLKVKLLNYSITEFLPGILNESIRISKCFLCDKQITQDQIEYIQKSCQYKLDRTQSAVSRTENELQVESKKFEVLQQNKSELKEYSKFAKEISTLSEETSQLSLKICENVFEQKKCEDEEKQLNEKIQELKSLQTNLIFNEKLNEEEIDINFYYEPELNDLTLKKLQQQESELSKRYQGQSTTLKQMQNTIEKSEERIGILKKQIEAIKQQNDITMEYDNEDIQAKEQEVQSRLEKLKQQKESIPFLYETKKE